MKNCMLKNNLLNQNQQLWNRRKNLETLVHQLCRKRFMTNGEFYIDSSCSCDKKAYQNLEMYTLKARKSKNMKTTINYLILSIYINDEKYKCMTFVRVSCKS